MKIISPVLTDKTGMLLFVLFSAFIFISKPAINTLYSLLMLLAILASTVTEYRQRLKKMPLGYFLIPLAVGCSLSVFSYSGINGPVEFLHRYRFLLLVIPFFLFIDSKEKVLLLLWAMNASALVDIIHIVFNSDLSDPFGHIHGFHKYGRHSDMMFTLCLANLTYIATLIRSRTFLQNKKTHIPIAVFTAILFITVICIGQRGAYLGLFTGLVVLLILFAKKLVPVLIALAMLSPVFLPDYVVKRTMSIIDPNQKSNSHRLKLIQLGFDFMTEKKIYITGAGVESVKSELIRFKKTKSAAYQKEYNRLLKLYPDNFHNSYLQMAIEGGIPFLICFMGGLAVLLIKIIRNNNLKDSYEMSCAVVLLFGFGVSQVFHEELFRYGGLVFLLSFYGSFIKKPQPA